MRYVLLVYGIPGSRQAVLGPDGERFAAELSAFMQALADSGELVCQYALADPSEATSTRPADGGAVVSDGPFAEADDQLGGLCFLDCETPERAQEILRSWPSARYCPLELRPLTRLQGLGVASGPQ
jgi:hypothetical protein